MRGKKCFAVREDEFFIVSGLSWANAIVLEHAFSKTEVEKNMFEDGKLFYMDEMNEKFNTKRGFIKAKWCGSAECEDEIKAATGGATTRCICKEDQVKDGDTCIFCGKQAKHVVYFGKAY